MESIILPAEGSRIGATRIDENANSVDSAADEATKTSYNSDELFTILSKAVDREALICTGIWVSRVLFEDE